MNECSSKMKCPRPSSMVAKIFSFTVPSLSEHFLYAFLISPTAWLLIHFYKISGIWFLESRQSRYSGCKKRPHGSGWPTDFVYSHFGSASEGVCFMSVSKDEIVTCRVSRIFRVCSSCFAGRVRMTRCMWQQKLLISSHSHC